MILVGGNIRGLTRTMTTTIALQTSQGDLSLALARSEPQMAQAVTLMTASRACWIFGSGTVSTRTSPFPCQHSARMTLSSKMPAPTGEIAKRSHGDGGTLCRPAGGSEILKSLR